MPGAPFGSLGVVFETATVSFLGIPQKCGICTEYASGPIHFLKSKRDDPCSWERMD